MSGLQILFTALQYLSLRACAFAFCVCTDLFYDDRVFVPIMLMLQAAFQCCHYHQSSIYFYGVLIRQIFMFYTHDSLVFAKRKNPTQGDSVKICPCEIKLKETPFIYDPTT